MLFALYQLLWCSLLLATAAAAEQMAFARDVRIQAPTISDIISADTVIYDTTSHLPSAELASGQILLHRHGCTTCHQLAVPGPTATPAPRLDAIGHKLDAAWLSAWLQNPFAYAPASKMPVVVLTSDERDALIAFLLSQAPQHQTPTIPERPADPYRGGDLFKSLQCLQCHQVAGEGGIDGPALDHIGRKTDLRWLYTLFKTPQLAQPGTKAHAYHLIDQDALDLSAYILRRFTSGDAPTPLAPTRTDSARITAGLAVALDKSCFQCHRIAAFDGPPLAAPTPAATAGEWVDYHMRKRGALPALSLSDTERRLMTRALQAIPDLLRTSAEAPTGLPNDFWRLPIVERLPVPLAFSPDARSLEPETCALCHVRQAREWSKSRHAQAFSPGLRSQLVGALEDTATIALCLTCHAPRLKATNLPQNPRPGTGIDCATCHVRDHLFFGPPAEPNRPPAERFTGGHHGTPIRSSALRQAAFCAPCHQFDDTGLALNGKPLQNTHGEWAHSTQRQEGQNCQSCHMPEGRHTWPGIRDPVLVGRALKLSIAPQPSLAGRFHAEIRLHNHGAGHHLPTYATPAILVKTFLVDHFGGVIDSTLQIRSAQRALQLDAERELFDTRIPAGGTWIFDFAGVQPAEAHSLQVVVEVDPDHFYRSFFAGFDHPQALDLAKEAHARLLDSPYILFTQSLPLE